MDDIRETSGIDSTTQMDGDFGTDFEAGLLGDGLEDQQTGEQDPGEGGADGLENQQPEGQQEQPEDNQQGGQEPPAEARQEQPPQLVPMTFNGQQIMLPQEAVQQLRGALGTDPVALLQKGMNYDHKAERELRVLENAVTDALTMAVRTFETGDLALARQVEPLEQVVDDLVRELKSRHVERLQSGECTIRMGFVLSDLTNNCERVADHCSNIAATLVEYAQGEFEMHGYTDRAASGAGFRDEYEAYSEKYRLPGD